MFPDALSDRAAIAEARRLFGIVMSQRRVQDGWFGVGHVDAPECPGEDGAFVNGMVAMFRYARGMDVPAVVVQDFRDELLKLMFGGLASGVLALPSFKRMEGHAWAMAWRLAELRLAVEGRETVDIPQLAHLLGMTPDALEAYLREHGEYDFSALPGGR